MVIDDKASQPGISTVITDNAPAPFGHYVQATFHDGLIYVSGQLPVHPDGTHASDAPFETQAVQAIENLLAVVRAAGSSPECILKVTAYLVGVEHWPTFNRVYTEIFSHARPARSVVPVPNLHHGYLVEIDAIAAGRKVASACNAATTTGE